MRVVADLLSVDGGVGAAAAAAHFSSIQLRYLRAVELRAYDAAHPFGSLSGSDNIISFETKRYVEGQALVVRGPGAGAEVTAGGVFGDVLRVCQYLGAPS